MILYIREQGVEIHRTGERLVLRKDGETLQEVRLRDVERIVLFGPIDMTTPAMYAILEAGIETDLLTEDGHYLGSLTPGLGKNVLLRRTQYRKADDPAFRLELARIMLDAKIGNCRYVISRHERNHPSDELKAALDALADARQRLRHADDVESCLGVEGDAARIYFAALGKMVRAEFAFTQRTRRPPRDPVNALLSFGYTLVMTECLGALAAHGLDPYVGMIHSTQYGRPALALDLLEEFRPVIADRIALSLVNKGELQPSDFQQSDDGGVRMIDEARTIYLKKYHRIMSVEIRSRTDGSPLSFRIAIQQQASRLRAAIEGRAPYDPYTPR